MDQRCRLRSALTPDREGSDEGEEIEQYQYAEWPEQIAQLNQCEQSGRLTVHIPNEAAHHQHSGEQQDEVQHGVPDSGISFPSLSPEGDGHEEGQYPRHGDHAEQYKQEVHILTLLKKLTAYLSPMCTIATFF